MNQRLATVETLSTETPTGGNDVLLRSPASTSEDVRITAGQLQALAMRVREELNTALWRSGDGAVATIKDSVLTVRVEHSLAAAEHHLMRRASGRAFFQHYVEELAEQIYPDLARHVEHILPCLVTYMRVHVDCEEDCIIFTFGLRPVPGRR